MGCIISATACWIHTSESVALTAASRCQDQGSHKLLVSTLYWTHTVWNHSYHPPPTPPPPPSSPSNTVPTRFCYHWLSSLPPTPTHPSKSLNLAWISLLKNTNQTHSMGSLCSRYNGCHRKRHDFSEIHERKKNIAGNATRTDVGRILFKLNNRFVRVLLGKLNKRSERRDISKARAFGFLQLVVFACYMYKQPFIRGCSSYWWNQHLVPSMAIHTLQFLLKWIYATWRNER